MNRKDSIILIEAMHPIKAKKVIYYDDPAFKGRYFNVFAPSKNVGPLPSKIPQQKIEAKRFTKEVVSQQFNGDEDDGEGATTEINRLADLAMSFQPEIAPDAEEMDNLVSQFWQTGVILDDQELVID